MMNLTVSVWPNARCSGLIGNPETGQRHAGEAYAEFLQRRATRDRLGHVLGEFIELVVHDFSFDFVFFLFCMSGLPLPSPSVEPVKRIGRDCNSHSSIPSF